MNFEKAQNRFRLLSGLSDNETERWNCVIAESMSYVRSLVIKPELSENDELRLSSLAGVFAYCKYLIYSYNADSDFRAGDITLRADRYIVANAKKIWETELNLNSDLVSEKGFVFRRVIS